MLINLLSPNNHVQFNITLANTIGLHEAIYLSELLDINDKAVRKKCIKDRFFKVNREYIKSRTTLPVAEQMKIDTELIAIGVLEVNDDDKNILALNTQMLVSIMSSEDEHLIDNVEKVIKASVKSSKKNKMDYWTKKAKESVITTNIELRTAYFEWIDSVMAKSGWLSDKAVIDAQEKIDSYSNRNLDVALAILKIAAANGYRDIVWAIKVYSQYLSIIPKSSMNTVQEAATKNTVSEVRF